MATGSKKQSPQSDFSTPPGRRGKDEDPGEAPALVVAIHILRPMAQKRRGKRQETDREQGPAA